MGPNVIRVAIAEDQRLFRECLIPILNNFDNIEVVFEASNGREMLTQLRQSPVSPHVVLLDLTMPEMNGLETTEVLKKEFPDLKIIILSVHNEERHIVRMVGMGVHGYLVKNAELTEVRSAIESVYDKGFYFNETVLKALQNGMTQKKTKHFEVETALTPREKEVLLLICKEFTTPEIADKLYLSVRTVDGHRNNLLEKTGSRNTAGLVLYAIKNGLATYD